MIFQMAIFINITIDRIYEVGVITSPSLMKKGTKKLLMDSLSHIVMPENCKCRQTENETGLRSSRVFGAMRVNGNLKVYQLWENKNVPPSRKSVVGKCSGLRC